MPTTSGKARVAFFCCFAVPGDYEVQADILSSDALSSLLPPTYEIPSLPHLPRKSVVVNVNVLVDPDPIPLAGD